MDSQLFAVMAGGGDSDAILRMNNDDGSDVATGFQRLFQDHPDFTYLQDIALDVDDGYFFVADSDGSTTRILRGNISDLAAGTGTPVLTEIYSGLPDQFIGGLEIDTVNNRLYFTDGDILSGHSLKRVDYDGNNLTDYGPVSLAFDPIFGFTGGIYDFVIDPAHDTAYMTYTLVDAFFSDPPSAPVNYIVKVNSLADPSQGYSIVPIVGSDDPDGEGGNPDNHFPESEGSLRGIDIDADAQVLYFVTGRLGPDGTAGIFKLDLATGVYTEIWEQPADSAHDTLQPYPQSLLEDIEVDTVGGVYYVTTFADSDLAQAHDGTATDEGGSRIFVGQLSDSGVAPVLFQSAVEPVNNGAPLGMEINYAATLVAPSAGIAFVEQGPAVDVIASPSITDPDGTMVKGATVAITGGFTSGDTLSFTPSSGIGGSYNSATGVLTLSGSGSHADYQAVLDSITFSASGDNPDNYGANATRTISTSLFDGLMYGDAATTTINIAAVNDAPVNTVGGPFAVLETDGPTAVTGLSVSDVDADPANDAISVTLSATLGTVNVSTAVAGGITAGQVTGNGTGNVVITATQNAINATFAAANGVTYDPANNGIDALTMTTNDLGNSGAGGAQQDVDAVVITVINVNDAPTAPANNSVTTAEDTASAATPIGATDPDNDTLTYSEKPGFGAANGTVTFDQTNGTFTYTPGLDFYGSDSFTILISDGNGGFAEQDVSVTVTPVNDAPTAVTGNLSAPEDAVNGSAAGTLVAQDPDSSSFTYELLDDAGGRFDMDSNGNVTVADGLLLDYEQASSHTIRVRVTDDMGASSEFDVAVSVADVLGEDVLGDGRDNIFFGGAEDDVLRGMDGNDILTGGGGQDTLEGGNGNDTIEGGAGNDNLQGGAGDDVLSGGLGIDSLVGGDGKDVYVLRKGEANGDTITGFFGMGAADGDSIVLEGYGAGTTFQRIGGGSSTLYEINDNGFVEYVTIIATGQVHSTDYTFDPPSVTYMNEFAVI